MIRLNRHGFAQLVDVDRAWLSTQPNTLERRHIDLILADAVDRYYPPAPRDVRALEDLRVDEIEALRWLLGRLRHRRSRRDDQRRRPERPAAKPEPKRYTRDEVVRLCEEASDRGLPDVVRHPGSDEAASNATLVARIIAALHPMLDHEENVHALEVANAAKAAP